MEIEQLRANLITYWKYSSLLLTVKMKKLNLLGKQYKTDKVKIDELSFALATINNPKPYKRMLCSFDINEHPVSNTKVVVSHNCL